jgi:lipoprotein-anchoring transpeptidase ErfK/SrfK
MSRIPKAFAALPLALLLTGCSSTPKPNPDQEKPLAAVFVNPFPLGTYQHFLAEPAYPKTYNVYRDPALLSKTNASNSSVRLNLRTQRGQLLNGDRVVIDYPISSGKSKYRTPPGSYKILEKLPEKRSNLYGTIYDAEGNVVTTDADMREDVVPEGGRYEGASMPYWMRLTPTGVGHHVGKVPRYPASHGCIRGPGSVLPQIYSRVKIGTPVEVIE